MVDGRLGSVGSEHPDQIIRIIPASNPASGFTARGSYYENRSEVKPGYNC